MRNRFPVLTLFMVAIVITMAINIGIARADPDVLYVDDDYDPSTPGWGIDHFSKIQNAVDAATDGDTIHVYSGTYYENIEVDYRNTLKFVAEKGGKPVKSVIIDGGGSDGFSLYDSIGVRISGFKIINAHLGITTTGTIQADYCDFSNNYIQDCVGYGIYVTGSHCNVTGNYLMNTDGIEVSSWDEIFGTVVSKNTILDSWPYYGIDLWNCVDCSITNNFIHNATVGIGLAYIGADCSGNMIMHNEMSDVMKGIKFEEPVYPGTPPMTHNIVGHNYIHDASPYPNVGIDIAYSGGGVAENTEVYHNTIEDFDVGIKNHGNYGLVHHNEAINCITNYMDLGTGNVDYKNSWNA